MVKTKILEIPTKGNCHIVDITAAVQEAVAAAELTDGTVTVFNVGSTAGVTTIEYEPGLVNHDINTAFEKIAPQHARYEHEETWHDDNGHAHVRATLLGPSLHRYHITTIHPLTRKQLRRDRHFHIAVFGDRCH
ncbi:MAG: YjbQ family protein [Planctomycetota bacterium]|jgi:secondary thiamine-phosphate synthase enzyme